VYRGHFRRSGSLRSVWHRRERKRRPLDPQIAAALHEQPPRVRYRYRPTEAEWQGGEPNTMLRCLVGLATGRGIVFHMPGGAVHRKLRLFYCACCRLLWNGLHGAGQQAVEIIERYADGQADAERLRAARRMAAAAVRVTHPVWTVGGYAPGAWDATNTARLAVYAAGVHARLRRGHVADGAPVGAADQAVLLRELFENPFRPVELPDRWFTSTVVALARAIHADRAFHLMPVLGDALQDAGCTRTEVLEHCYGPGPHVPGCWLLDRLTGRDSA
jgi:hypothetical protein